MRLRRLTVVAVLVLSLLGLVAGYTGAAGNGPVKIGMITPLTGPSALDGTLVMYGAKIAVGEINKGGGLLGRQVELYVEDGKADPTESVNAAQKLINQNRVCALIGCWASSATLAVMPIVKKAGVPLIVETSTNPQITEQGNEWVFRTCSNEVLNSEFMASAAVRKLGFKKVAFMPVNNDWGRGAFEQYSAVMKREGAQVLPPEYHDANAVNFYASLNKIRNMGADSVVITTSIQTQNLILRQMRELGMDDVKILSTGGYSGATMLKAAGDPALLEGVYVLGYSLPMALKAGGDLAKRVGWFIDLFKKAYPSHGDPDRGCANGYDAVNVIAEAVKIAKSDNPAEIRDALERVQYKGITGDLSFDDKHQAHPVLYVTQMRSGQQELVSSNN